MSDEESRDEKRRRMKDLIDSFARKPTPEAMLHLDVDAIARVVDKPHLQKLQHTEVRLAQLEARQARFEHGESP